MPLKPDQNSHNLSQPTIAATTMVAKIKKSLPKAAPESSPSTEPLAKSKPRKAIKPSQKPRIYPLFLCSHQI
jgi:hypothetical protein